MYFIRRTDEYHPCQDWRPGRKGLFRAIRESSTSTVSIPMLLSAFPIANTCSNAPHQYDEGFVVARDAWSDKYNTRRNGAGTDRINRRREQNAATHNTKARWSWVEMRDQNPGTENACPCGIKTWTERFLWLTLIWIYSAINCNSSMYRSRVSSIDGIARKTNQRLIQCGRKYTVHPEPATLRWAERKKVIRAHYVAKKELGGIDKYGWTQHLSAHST